MLAGGGSNRKRVRSSLRAGYQAGLDRVAVDHIRSLRRRCAASLARGNLAIHNRGGTTRIEQRAAGTKLLEKSVRFAHQPQGPNRLVVCVNPEGMSDLTTCRTFSRRIFSFALPPSGH